MIRSASLSFLIPFFAIAGSLAAPTRRALFDFPTILDDVLLLDAPAVVSGSGDVTAEVESYVFDRQIDLGPLTDAVKSVLGDVGLGDLGDAAGNIGDRLKLFASKGNGGKSFNVKLDGCSQSVTLGPTGGEDAGIALQNVTLGQCTGSSSLNATADLSSIDLRDITSTVFSSPEDGFAVISDIDDTVKISNVLDKAKLAKATLIDTPAPVSGMPELYSSLSQSLGSPQFLFVSGSPLQLYPFLQPFIASTYSGSRGPLFLRNLTLTDIGEVLNVLTDENATFDFKTATIDRIRGLYPKKKFLTIGDSTEKDPETYGLAFRKYGGDAISCIWIRKVEGANNTDERFAEAFQGVPKERFRLYNDSDIAGLKNVDVKGGSC